MSVLQVDGEHRQVTQGSNSHAQQFHVVSQGETNNVDWTKKISIQCESQTNTGVNKSRCESEHQTHPIQNQYDQCESQSANTKKKRNNQSNRDTSRQQMLHKQKTRKNTNTNAVPTGYQQRKGFLEKRGDNN